LSIEIRGQDRYVDANGLRHHVLQYGEQFSADLLILPGITSPAATADFIAVRLADLGYRIHVVDLRGRGGTPAVSSGHYRLAEYAADVAGLIDSLGLSDPVVIGHSLGARVAAAYGVEHARTHHGLIVMVDPPTSGPGREPYPMTKDSFRAQLQQARAGTTADEVRFFFPRWPERELQLRAEWLASCDEEAVMETHWGFENEDFFEYWRELTQPALLVRGEDSHVVPPAAADELRSANPTIDVIDVPEAGHMVPWDNLAGFLDAVTPALVENLRSPAAAARITGDMKEAPS
jgi:N-formylmaleamate deformylase